MEHHELSFIRKYVFSTDHKVIGMQYLLTGLAMIVLGGTLAFMFRMQLAFPGIELPIIGALTAEQYNTFVTMHGTIMIFWVAMPMLLAGFGNLLIPLMVGADDMAFPTLNAISYWVFLISTIIIISSFFAPNGAYAGGWTFYPPLSANAYVKETFFQGMGGNFWIIAVALEFVAFLLGGINFIVTTFNMRAKGLTWYRMPLALWMFLMAVMLFMFSVGPLIAGVVMLLFDRTIGTGFFNPVAGGDPLLFQHMFWFFGHPEVYVLLLPSLGIVAEVLTTFSRKPLFAYKPIIYATFVAGVLSFIVWAHHQFISGIDPRMSSFFSITTILISIPFTISILAYMATLYKGALDFKTPMLFAVGFIAEFLIGGITGIYLGSSAYDIFVHDTYFVVAHFHYALIPVVIFGGFSGIYYWYPKFIGRKMNETLGKLHFWGTTIGFNGIFIPLFFVGAAGQHRRIFDYSAYPSLMTDDFVHMRIIATSSLILMILSQIPFVINLFRSRKKGEIAGPNPWKANSLEWQCPSPPPHGNFAEVPTVYRGPYEYSVEGRAEDYWPQNVK